MSVSIFKLRERARGREIVLLLGENLNMNKAIWAAVAAFGIVAGAQAQGYPYNFTVRGGVVFPIDSSYSNVSSTFFGVGIDYTFTSPLIKGGETYLSLDYHAKTFGKDKGSVFPIALNQRIFGKANSEGNRTYAFFGLGATVVDFAGSETVLGARLGVGIELSTSLIGEATLYLADKKNGVQPNSFGLFLGYKF